MKTTEGQWAEATNERLRQADVKGRVLQLVAIDGTLYMPACVLDHYDMIDQAKGTLDPNRTHGPIMLFRYPEGDCDTLSWPLSDTSEQLAVIVSDMRECGWIEDSDVVLLPNGEKINVD